QIKPSQCPGLMSSEGRLCRGSFPLNNREFFQELKGLRRLCGFFGDCCWKVAGWLLFYGSPGARRIFGGHPQPQTTSKRGLRGMSGTEGLDSKADALGHLSQAYFGGLDVMVKGYEPALKGIGRWTLELMGFMARRARAWLEVPGQLGQLRSPVELFK